MTDLSVRDDVLEELRFDPRVNAAHIGVAVRAGVVMLSGHVGSFAEKFAAIIASRRVKGVSAIADELEVLFPEDKKTADDDIAQRAADVIRWDAMLPPTIKLTVRHGMVMLSGKVEWFYQRVVSEENVRRLAGVTGVVNNIAVVPAASPTDVIHEIEKALKRNAEVEAKSIRVHVENGNHVILEGKVHTFSERAAIENAAWCVPGVQTVDDRLTVAVARAEYQLS